MMNNDDFFVWKRFRFFFIKTLKERMKSNLIMAGLMFATMLIVVIRTAFDVYGAYMIDTKYEFVPTYDMMHDAEFFIFTLFLFICGCLWASQMMRGMKTKASRIFALTTPVTQFEAWLTRWIIHVPMFILVFLVSMYATDLIRYAIFSSMKLRCPVEILSWKWDSTFSFYVLFYLLLSAFYAVGSTFFPRRPILITSFVLFFLGLVFGFASLTALVLGNLFAWEAGFTALQVYMGLSVIFLWWLSYKRYTELEIIDRM